MESVVSIGCYMGWKPDLFNDRVDDGDFNLDEAGTEEQGVSRCIDRKESYYDYSRHEFRFKANDGSMEEGWWGAETILCGDGSGRAVGKGELVGRPLGLSQLDPIPQGREEMMGGQGKCQHDMSFDDTNLPDNYGYDAMEEDFFRNTTIDHQPIVWLHDRRDSRDQQGVAVIIDHIDDDCARGRRIGADYSITPCHIVRMMSDDGDYYFFCGETLEDVEVEMETQDSDACYDEDKIAAFMKRFPRYFGAAYPVRWFFKYHYMLTGSCEDGRLDFMQSTEIDMDDIMTVEEFIKMSRLGDYELDIIDKLDRAYRKEMGCWYGYTR